MATLEQGRILRTLEERIGALRELGVRKLGLFGSHLHGTATEGSDLDFLVQLSRPSFDDYMETKFFLEDLFGRRVDLVTEKALKPALRHVKHEAAYVPGTRASRTSKLRSSG